MRENETGTDQPRPTAAAYEAGHHAVSPHNFDAAAEMGFTFPQPLIIFDSTLRKALYVSGYRPSIGDLMFIAEELEEAGIQEEIVNIQWWGDPAPDKIEHELCRAIMARGFTFHTTVSLDWFSLSRAGSGGRDLVPAREAVEVAREAGASTISVSLHAPEDDSERARQLERLEEAFVFAQSLGLKCSLSMNDVGRMDFETVVEFANEGVRLGAIRMDLSDSYSSLSPEGMRLFVKRFRSRLAAAVPVTIHVHNDFGLGTAAAIAAATAGAHPDTAVNGISYRAGFAALEEVAVSLEMLYGVRTGLRMERFQRLSRVVSERIGLPLPVMKPITGPNAWVRDFPWWMVPYLKNGPQGFPPPGACFDPAQVGAKLEVVWGAHHSDASVRAKLEQMGLPQEDQQVLEIRRRIEKEVAKLERYPRWLTEAQVEKICLTVAREQAEG